MFFKKKNKPVEQENKALVSCVDGVLIPIEEVLDPVFSKKMMGDGFAIKSTGDTICACADAVVTMIFPTNHAIGLTCADGMEILIHIGIDTVDENGEGFTMLVNKDQEVNANEPLVRINRSYLLDKGYDLSVICVFTKADAYSDFALAYGRDVKCGDFIGHYITK